MNDKVITEIKWCSFLCSYVGCVRDNLYQLYFTSKAAQYKAYFKSTKNYK